MTYEGFSPDELRELYVKATLRQRYRVALDRIEYAHLGPSLFVNVMAALEGFARAVALKKALERGDAVGTAYNRIRNLGPVELLTLHVCPAYDTTPAAAFGDDAWEKLPDAVRFRNLLVHEATFLHGGTCDTLIGASQHILTRLAEMSGAA